MKSLPFLGLVLLCLPAWAQKPDLNFGALSTRAAQKAEVDLDQAQLAKIFGTQALKGAFEGAKAVHVRNYEFAKDGMYGESDLAPLRKQVGGGSGWARIVNIKEKDEATEIYLLTSDNEPAGLLLISAEARELTVVWVEGRLDLVHLQELVSSSIHYSVDPGAAGQH